jgi:hypothetical protein
MPLRSSRFGQTLREDAQAPVGKPKQLHQIPAFVDETEDVTVERLRKAQPVLRDRIEAETAP